MRLPTVMLAVVVAACGGSSASPAAPHAVAPADVTARATAAVDAFTNDSPRLTRDGRVVFISNRDGLPQLYVGRVDQPAAPPLHLPTPAERVATPSLLPDDRTVVFLSDVGTDQRFHVFRIGLDGSGLADLTPDGDLRRDSLQVAAHSGLLAYTGHVLADQTTHVFVQAADGAPREIYRDPAVAFITDITADGSRLLLIRALSDTSSVALVVDTQLGTATRVFPPDGSEQQIADGSFAADGASAILAIGARGVPPSVVRVDTRSGAELARYVEGVATTGAPDDVQVSRDGRSVVAAIDAGEHVELRLLDPQTLHLVAAPVVPLGVISPAPFSADGARLPVTVRGPAGPADIAVLDLATRTLAPLRADPRPGLGTPPTATVEHLRAFDGRTLPVNLYLPPGAASAKLPTLVLVHGGPTGVATITWSPAIGFWTAMGFAVVAPNIRGSTGFGIDYMEADDRGKRGDAVADIASVNAWARAQPWCDGSRMVIGGISYGGYMTLLALARLPGLWAAGIDGSGMSNLVTMEQLEDQTIRSFDDTEFGVLGKDDALLQEWSPITHVDHIVAPVFVYQGVRDPVTPQHEADQIVAALRGRRVPVEYMLVDNEGHGVTRRENVIAYLTRSYRFLALHLNL